jgi:hypothetical protein
MTPHPPPPSPACGRGGADGSPRDVQTGALAEQAPGVEAFGFLVDGIRGCIEAGLARPADPFRTATNVWTALHGLVSLRWSAPGFPWPPLAEQLDDLLSGLVGVDRAALAEAARA